MNDTELLSQSIVKALAYAENGGKPDLSNLKSGKTGEMKSIFQFTPDTWKKYAKDILGDENSELNPDNETYVANEKVKKWIQEGKTARQIASMWNAGPGEPDAYSGKFSNGSPSVGINKKYNVKFDVPSYADKVLKYSKEFFNEKSSHKDNPVEQEVAQNSDPLQSVVSLVKKASSRTPSNNGSYATNNGYDNQP